MRDEEFIARVRRHRPSTLIPKIAKLASQSMNPADWLRPGRRGLATPWALGEISRVSIAYSNEHRQDATTRDVLLCNDAYNALDDPELGDPSAPVAGFFLRTSEQLVYQERLLNELARTTAILAQTPPKRAPTVLRPGWDEDLFGVTLAEFSAAGQLLHMACKPNEGRFNPAWLSLPSFAFLRDHVDLRRFGEAWQRNFIVDRQAFAVLNGRASPSPWRRFSYNPLLGRPAVSGFHDGGDWLIPVPGMVTRRISMGGVHGSEAARTVDFVVTEKALSVDNLFVFLIIMQSFRVPREDQQKVLLFGIVFALVARTGFIFLGAALINQFAWIFYLFGLVLILTAGNMLKSDDEEKDAADNLAVRAAKKVMYTTDHYDGDKLFAVVDGKRAMTPMLLVVVAIGATDILFALDSIPAIFGLTPDTYRVFTAVAFSLIGLRQLFFLNEGLLDRLIYLSYGLAAILAFIGVELILHALHENNLPFVNDGQPVPVFEVSTALSLTVIIGILVVTVTASLLSPAGRARNAVNGVRRYATSYIDSEHAADPDERENIFRKLLEERDRLMTFGPRSRAEVRNDADLMALLDHAIRSHDEAVTRRDGVSAGPSRILD